MQSTLLIFKSTVVAFRVSVQRVRDVADDVLANTTKALSDPALLRRHDTVVHAVIVMLSGFFEAFLKDVAERYADEITKKGMLFTDLPDRIRHTHFGGGGKVLANIGRKSVPGPYRWVLSTAGELARRLSSVGNQPYELVWEAFAETQGNPGRRSLRSFWSDSASNSQCSRWQIMWGKHTPLFTRNSRASWRFGMNVLTGEYHW